MLTLSFGAPLCSPAPRQRGKIVESCHRCEGTRLWNLVTVAAKFQPPVCSTQQRVYRRILDKFCMVMLFWELFWNRFVPLLLAASQPLPPKRTSTCAALLDQQPPFLTPNSATRRTRNVVHFASYRSCGHGAACRARAWMDAGAPGAAVVQRPRCASIPCAHCYHRAVFSVDLVRRTLA